MPKMKTRKSVTTRFKISKNGKMTRRHSSSRHLKVKKSAKRRSRLSKSVPVNKSFARRVRKALGL